MGSLCHGDYCEPAHKLPEGTENGLSIITGLESTHRRCADVKGNLAIVNTGKAQSLQTIRRPAHLFDTGSTF